MSLPSTSQEAKLLYKKNLGLPYAVPSGSVTAESGNSRVFVPANRIMNQTIPTSINFSADFTKDVSYTGGGERWIHKTYSYIVYYKDLPLTYKSAGLSFYYSNASYPTYNLQQTIPFNYDPNGSYNYTVIVNGITKLQSDDAKPWILDPDAGFLTFFASVV